MIADKIEALLDNKIQDADAISKELSKLEVETVIHTKRKRRQLIPKTEQNIVGLNLSNGSDFDYTPAQPSPALQQTQKLASHRHKIR